jgi:hypothetical protein
VTDLGNLFDPGTGIYANAYQDGIAWERPASIELIYPDGTKGFQINAGIRIRGGYSRSGGNPKHAFRFFFRQEYGASKLKYPMFARQDGVDSFDGFDLRTFENYSWSFDGDYRFIALRDQFSRDAQARARRRLRQRVGIGQRAHREKRDQCDDDPSHPHPFTPATAMPRCLAMLLILWRRAEGVENQFAVRRSGHLQSIR